MTGRPSRLSQSASRRRSGALVALRRVARAAAVVVAAAAIGAFVAMVAWPPLLSVETGQTAEYPQLRPRAYAKSSDRVAAGVREVVEADERVVDWQPVDDGSGVVATRQVAWPVGSVRVSARVEPNGEGGAIVFVRSEGGFLRSDFGANARAIDAFFADLDANLGVVEPTP